MSDWIALVVALTGLFAAIGGTVKVWYDVRSVHKIVNQRQTDLLAKIEELRQVLAEERGIRRPPE